MTDAPPVLDREHPDDGAVVEALIDRSFGPGRYVKTAERLREGRAPRLDLSFVARDAGAVVGCVRLYDIFVGNAPALLLGPFAVAPSHRSRGLGAALIRQACAAAKRDGHGVVLLVGDETYFAALGFEAAPAAGVVLPGPVDQKRVLALALKRGATDNLHGLVAAGRP